MGIVELLAEPRTQPRAGSMIIRLLQDLIVPKHFIVFQVYLPHARSQRLGHQAVFVVLVSEQMPQFVHDDGQQVDSVSQKVVRDIIADCCRRGTASLVRKHSHQDLGKVHGIKIVVEGRVISSALTPDCCLTFSSECLSRGYTRRPGGKNCCGYLFAKRLCL